MSILQVFSDNLQTFLLGLGFKVSLQGTKYIKKMILLLCFEEFDLNLKKLSIFIGNSYEVKSSKVLSEIKYSINTLDINTFKSNFKSIFGFDYTPSILTSKEIIYLIYNKVLRNKKSSF